MSNIKFELGLLQDKTRLVQIQEFCNTIFSGLNFEDILIRFSERIPNTTTKAYITIIKNVLIVQYNYKSDDSYARIVEALYHESVHARQLSVGELKYVLLIDGPIEWGFKWKGDIYRMPKTDIEIINLPWELEAARLTEEFFENYS